VNYLFGDSTPSALRTNFLELLRDALDFGVFVLQADESIQAGRAMVEALNEEAQEELARLDAFAAIVLEAIGEGDKGDLGSPTATYAMQLADLARDAQRSTDVAVRGKLSADVAAIDADEAASRGACHDALFAFLAPHADAMSTEPATRRIVLLESGTYAATESGHTSFGIAWTIDLGVPQASLFAEVVRLERITPQVEIMAPQVTGWITKEVKVKPQRLERFTVTEIACGGAHTFVKLRVEASVETGFDVEVDAGVVKMTRVGPSDDASVGAFDVDTEGAAIIVELTDKLRASVNELESAQLREATIDGAPFAQLMPFRPLVERLVAMLAPIVREISQRSLTATELVLRRALGDDRREEFFVTKTTLREKYAPLSPQLRALFTPLGFDAPPVPSAARPPPPPPSEKAPARAEIKASAPSQPPMKTPSVAPPPPAPPPPPPPPPAATLAKPPTPATASGKNEAFVEAVKKIVLVLKSGRTDEGYTQYAELLSSPGFAEYRADDQRQALKLLLLAKAPPHVEGGRSDAVSRAYKIALQRIQSLVDTLAEPADYEMLGVAHLQLEDHNAASAAFDIALKLERARNPQSELCASLGRRIAQIASQATN
jgi:hypothetical protein